MSSDLDTLDRISAEASDWFITNRTGCLSAAEREKFVTWLEASPVHVREYLSVAEAWEAMKVAGTSDLRSADDLIAAAKLASNVVKLPSAAHGSQAQRVMPRRPVALAASVLAAVAALLGVIVLVGSWNNHVYSTARGEQRSIVLQDGSVIQLNTLSKMSVHFDEARRRVELTEGEAYFRVAHDPTRPFDVITQLATVRAIGTQFNVYQRDDKLKVFVVDGRVRVSATDEGGSGLAAIPSAPVVEVPLSLSANEAVELSGQGVARASVSASAAHATSWIQRRLTFDDERLDAVIAEFNRYTPRQMHVTDPTLAGLRISGVFDADEPETLVAYLEQVQNVNVIRQGTSITFSPGAGPSLDR